MLGDLRDLHSAGYAGPIEYEVFWDQMGKPEPAGVLDRAVCEYLRLTEKAEHSDAEEKPHGPAVPSDP